MTWILVALAALVVFVIAALVVGREAHRLDAVAPQAVYVLDDASAYVADRLSSAAQAQLTPAELAQLLVAHMGRLHAKGLQPIDVTDRRQDLAQPLILDEIDETAFLIGEMDSRAIDVTDQVVAEVTTAHLAYLDDIGAVGPPATDDVAE